MKTILILIPFLVLSACGGSDNDSAFLTQPQIQKMIANALSALPKDDDSQAMTQIAVLQTQLQETSTQLTDAQKQVAELQQAVAKLQLIGKAHTGALRVNPSIESVSQTVDFGPCTDMGTLIGRGGSDNSDPIQSQWMSFITCSGYSYTISGIFGTIAPPHYLTWDGPNCTGNLLIETDVPGNGYSPTAVSGGVVFANPISGAITMIRSGQTPELRTIQSAYNVDGGICNVDVEVRQTVATEANDVSVTGVQDATYPVPIVLTSP